MFSASEHHPAVFLYEDDHALAQQIVLNFASEDQLVSIVEDEESLEHLPDACVLILDRMIGNRDSLDVVTRLRAQGKSLFVIFISSRATLHDRIAGFRSGGDDYLTKPFAMGELIARVTALSRRSAAVREQRLSVGPLAIDRIKRMAWKDGQIIHLQPRELRLLEYLMTHAGQVVTRSMLLEDIWNFRSSTHTNVVDVHISNLRRKIGDTGPSRLISSVPGLGFRLEAPRAF